MKQQIVKISIVQSSKIIALLYGVLGLLFALMGILMSLVLGGEFFGRTLILYFLCAPIFYLVIGFVTSLVMFWCYNLIARITGGIEFELKEVSQT